MLDELDNTSNTNTVDMLMGKQKVPMDGYELGYNVILYNDDKSSLEIVYRALHGIGLKHEEIAVHLAMAQTGGYSVVYNSQREFPLKGGDLDDMIKRSALYKSQEIEGHLKEAGLQCEILFQE